MKRVKTFQKSPLFYLLYAALLFPLLAQAQQGTSANRDTVVLEGFISSDKTLTPDKIYHVRFNVKVGKSAMLSITPGTTVVFDPNTSIVLEGGLNINGAPNNFIEFSSRDINAPGNGITIRGGDGADVKISYTVFRGLNIPLRFEPEWYRKNVIIEKNVFTELFSGESGVLITSPLVDYKPGADNTINLSFSNNAFYKNWGSIFIENFEDNNMRLKFNNNLIASNVVYGIDIGIPSNTPVFGLFDDLGNEHKMEMQGNSIFGNYQINSATDTVIREISVGIQGDGQEFSIPNNFFRSKNADYIYSTFDHFYQNPNLPLLKAEPFLPEPQEITPPHIWKVKINGSEIQDYDDVPRNIDVRDVAFEVYFNKAVSPVGATQLEAVSYDSIAGKILKTPVTLSQVKWSPERKVLSFVVSNASFMRDPFTFLILSNFKDEEGFVTPNFQIGQRRAINRFKIISTGLGRVKTSDLMNQRQGIINVDADGATFLPDEKSVKTIEALTDFGGLSALGPYRSLTKTWEVGLVLGTSNYMGTLTYKLVDKTDFHFSIGAFGQYNLNKWISLRAMLWYGRISGNDSDDPDPDRHMRHFNFRNDLLEGSLTFHWHLLKYGSSRGEKFTPTIFAGISLYRNKPMGRIFLYERDFDPGFGENYGDPVYLTYSEGQFLFDGSGEEVWVSLRDIGTEGQTQEFGTDPEADPLRNSPYASLFTDHKQPKQYSKVQVAFPIGVSLDYIVYNKWVISVELGARISTTKYLDDVGGYYWDRGSNYVFDSEGRAAILTDPNTGIPIDAHQSIIDANPEIWGKVNGEKILLPTNLQFTDPNNGRTTEYYTAALLANPSLVDVDEGMADPNFNRPTNDAFTFNNAKRANPKSRDHFGFIGVKVSKVIPNAKERKKYKKEKKKKDAFVAKTNVKDSDKDGLPDADEKLAGTNPKNYDTDGDLLSDGEEVNQFKSDPLKKDTDGDGLDDGKEVRETETDPTLADTDGDGLTDGKEVNVTKTNPNVFDTDNGGIGDGEEVNVYKTNPLNPADDPIDSDGDGVLDSQDDCPKVKGLAQFKGCPDSDGDGIPDAKDSCPYEAGVASNSGCPEVKPEVVQEEKKKEVEEDLQALFKNIEFDTNKDVIRSVSYGDLNKAAEILAKYKEYNVIIEGHTDNVGNAAANKTLSQKRADAVKKYLMSRDIASSRITATGYGAERPKVSNDTESGRQANRRVEIRLIRP